ncbi:hypothetical protein EV1_033631 [Malus domestica]
MVVQVVVVLCLMLHLEYTHAVTQAVGDSSGWTFNSDNWPKGKHFRADNVLVGDKGGYSSCTTSSVVKVFRSSKDRVRLGRGQNYFICSFPGHCKSGMKVAINCV